MPSSTKSFFTVANDLGYGSLKFAMDNQDGKMTQNHVPSTIAIQQAQDLTKPAHFDSQKQEDDYINTLIDRLDVSIASPSVKTPGRFLIGNRAIKSGLPWRESFDVNDFTGKSESDLSLILTLSVIAGRVLQANYQSGKPLPTNLSADILMATALPIAEGQQTDVTEHYAERYTDKRHVITIHNFEEPITINLHFINVYVALEGEAAQFSIVNAAKTNPKMGEAIFGFFKEHYPKMAAQLNLTQLLHTPNVLGIDIGEGTTDFPVINQGRANPTVSMSLPTGYGNVLQRAINELQNHHMNFQTRAEVQAFLDTPVSPLPSAQQYHQRVEEIVRRQFAPLVQSIVEATSKTMRQAGANIDVLYIYGGGSIPLAKYSNLYNTLVEKTKGFTGGIEIPIIIIPANYAQLMNLDGLILIAQSLRLRTKSN